MIPPTTQPALAASAGSACPFCLQVHGEETLCACWICDAYVHPHFLHRWVVEGHRVAICPGCAEDPEEQSKHKVRAMVLEAALREITRTAYDEANRIANHCSDGAARWAMRNLYDAANKAKAVLSPNAPRSATPEDAQ